MGINQRFSIVLDPDGDGFFNVRIPAIPEISARSTDPGDAMAMAGALVIVTRDLKILDYARRGEVRGLGC